MTTNRPIHIIEIACTPGGAYVYRQDPVRRVNKRLNLDASFYTLLQKISLTLFEKMPIQQAFAGRDYKTDTTMCHNQLNLFES